MVQPHKAGVHLPNPMVQFEEKCALQQPVSHYFARPSHIPQNRVVSNKWPPISQWKALGYRRSHCVSARWSRTTQRRRVLSTKAPQPATQPAQPSARSWKKRLQTPILAEDSGTNTRQFRAYPRRWQLSSPGRNRRRPQRKPQLSLDAPNRSCSKDLLDHLQMAVLWNLRRPRAPRKQRRVESRQRRP